MFDDYKKNDPRMWLYRSRAVKFIIITLVALSLLSSLLELLK